MVKKLAENTKFHQRQFYYVGSLLPFISRLCMCSTMDDWNEKVCTKLLEECRIQNVETHELECLLDLYVLDQPEKVALCSVNVPRTALPDVIMNSRGRVAILVKTIQ